ncbi:LemA family protein [Telmatobacter bradus]|jgi:LemA protein|uniref:LemA family protein n=1 Tax=Telmatobacter bradus TaxID=474953 RepID=UPI003B430881
MSRGVAITLAVVGGLFALVLLVAAGLGLNYVHARNAMVEKDQSVKEAWSNVDTQLQRRADLIPNLVETVKGFARQETTVYGDIANARAGLLNAQGPAAKMQANGRLDSAIGRLLMLTENYPQLRSNEQFLRLQDELSGTENRISVARKRYNDSLKDYNTFVLSFPNNIWAGMSGFQPNNAYFQASEAARTVPQVKF